MQTVLNDQHTWVMCVTTDVIKRAREKKVLIIAKIIMYTLTPACMHAYTDTHTLTHERERERDRQTDRDTESMACLHTCIHMHAYTCIHIHTRASATGHFSVI